MAYFNPITDVSFYVVAIPAILFLGISKSGFGAGFGSLSVPLMAFAVSVPQAAAICMPVLLAMDLLGMAAYRKDFNRQLVWMLLPWALLGTVIGTLAFGYLDPDWVKAILGIVILIFLGQRHLLPADPNRPAPPLWAGKLLSVVGGFTSFLAHAGGPPFSAYLLPQKLSPVVFTATMAFLFFFVNLSKWVPYAYLGLFDARNLATAVVLLPLVPIGVWLGIRIARRISPSLFYRLISVGMLLTGIKLLYDGLT